MRNVRVLLILTLLLMIAGDAFAQRRMGLGGKYSARYMTAAKGSVMVIAGPKSSQLLGESFGPFGGGDAGFQYSSFSVDAGPFGSFDLTSTTLSLGAAYGITPNIEAGLMLPLNFSEGGDLIGSLPLFLTYGKVVGGNMDIGARLTGYIPLSGGDFLLNPGIPFNMRTGNGRLEAGLFVPLVFGDSTNIGLNIPLRYAMSFTPNVFAGIQTGFKNGSFDAEADMFIPLGLFAGYTLLAGGSVIDFTGEFSFDSFLYLDGPEGSDTLMTNQWRFGVGANIQIDVAGG